MGSNPVKYVFYLNILMGALTLKSFPFILRSWNVKNYDSIDPTDSFGQETKVYVNKNKVVKIEPQFTNNISNPWLTDKGRQFFDGIFTNLANEKSSNETYVKNTNQWNMIFSNLQKTFYIFDICNFKNVNKFYYFIVFENLNIENLSFLSLISQVHPFIKIKRAENVKINNDLETDFQINSATSTSALASSSLCLLVGTNTRNEGSSLNLKLRQRYFKGNFKFLTIGSFLNLTFPVSFLGSNLSILKLVIGGNLTACQDLANASNPILIANSDIFKKNNLFELFNSLKTLKHANILSKIWNGYNVLNSSIYDTGLQNLGQFSFFLLKDLLTFSSLHIINVNLNNVANFKKVVESRIINHKSLNEFDSQKFVLNQNFNSASAKYKKSNFLYLPNNLFFDFQETFINTEGLIKRTTKLITRKNVKTDWQLLRKFVQIWNLNSSLNNFKNAAVVCYNNNNTFFDFKNFIGFQFYASKTLTNINFYLIDKPQKFSIYKKFIRFKVSTVKLFDVKLKYWLDDFYTGGKDKFCQNSLTLTRCSMNYKLQVTNFF
jgi:NADH-quinone oxidoreductase subunit G